MGLTEQETTVANRSLGERNSGLIMLPSHLFFVRGIALPAGIAAEEIASFVEVSMEQISPFVLNQLYYGYYLPPGGSHLLMFAAYRKQLAVYEDEEWSDADLVLPDFVPVLGIERTGATLVFLQDEHEVSAVYWAVGSEVPDRVLSRAYESVAEAKEANREAIREELIKKFGPFPADVKTFSFERGVDGGIRDKSLIFELREADGKKMTTEIVRPGYLSMDVRDKGFLAATRKTRRQNRLLWVGVLALLAAFVAMGIFEAALYAGHRIVENRERSVRALIPEVDRIMEQEKLANRLEELGGERLLPFEMLDYLNQTRPPSVYFTAIITDGLRSFRVDALTPRSPDVDRYQRIMGQSEALGRIEIRDLRTRPDGHTSFSIIGTFREGTLGQRTETTPAGRGGGGSASASGSSSSPAVPGAASGGAGEKSADAPVDTLRETSRTLRRPSPGNAAEAREETEI